MGMFDSVKVPCPKCGKEQLFQSKGGDCILEEYTLENAPLDVLMDINRHAPYGCLKCGCEFAVQVKTVCNVVDFSELETKL
jgi:transcription elongation factor Elf1